MKKSSQYSKTYGIGKAVIRGKLIAIQAYLRKIETFQKKPNPTPTGNRGTTTKTA